MKKGKNKGKRKQKLYLLEESSAIGLFKLKADIKHLYNKYKESKK